MGDVYTIATCKIKFVKVVNMGQLLLRLALLQPNFDYFNHHILILGDSFLCILGLLGLVVMIVDFKVNSLEFDPWSGQDWQEIIREQRTFHICVPLFSYVLCIFVTSHFLTLEQQAFIYFLLLAISLSSNIVLCT